MARSCGPRPYKRVSVDLPVFAILMLRKNARDTGKSVSELVERMVLENMMVDDVRAAIADSPDFAKAFSEWFRYATTRDR